MSDLIKVRRDTAANWASANPVLADGEPGWDKTAKRLKVGDGTTAWNSLGYVSGGGVLGVTSYNPSSLASYTTTSGTLADIDATNLAVSFIAPASGKVVVSLSGLAGISSSTNWIGWALNEGSTMVPGSLSQIGTLPNDVNWWACLPLVVDGLTPSSSHTYKWAWKLGGNATGVTGRLYAGGVAGQAVMKVEAA